MAGAGGRITLGYANPPPAPHQRPRVRSAEARYSDGTWRPVTILAWHHLQEPYQSIMSPRKITWLVRLRFTDMTDGWYHYVAGNLRPGQRIMRSAAA